MIGEPCIDVIHKADGKVYHEHGGISYSVVASTVANDAAETVPVIGLGTEDLEYFRGLFDRLDHLNPAGIYQTAAPVRRVDLFYEDENNRWECSTQPIEPTSFEKISPFLPADGIHLNLIGGNDIKIDTLKKIRNAAPGCHMHLDLHNIVMNRQPDGRRVRGPRADYLEWSGLADTVQMNEEEAAAIDIDTTDKRRLAEKILDTGVKAFVVSLAERGILLFEKRNGKVEQHIFPSKMVDVVDPTGSGDVFGAVFLHAVVNGRDFSEASKEGIEFAARKVGAAGPSGFLQVELARRAVSIHGTLKSVGANVK